MEADDIFRKAADAALPSVTATTLALCEQAMAKGIEAAVDTMRALAADIIAGRAPVTDIKDAADMLERTAKTKRAEAAKVLHRN